MGGYTQRVSGLTGAEAKKPPHGYDPVTQRYHGEIRYEDIAKANAVQQEQVVHVAKAGGAEQPQPPRLAAIGAWLTEVCNYLDRLNDALGAQIQRLSDGNDLRVGAVPTGEASKPDATADLPPQVAPHGTVAQDMAQRVWRADVAAQALGERISRLRCELDRLDTFA